ncbi:MAG TPA: hypothetical protein VLJ60_03325 [bacterium]|nr:hypothetical protein [bacterium]
MKKILLFFAVISVCYINAADFTTYYSDKSEKSVASLEFVKKLAEKYPDINFKNINVTENAETKKNFKELIEKFEMEKAVVPLFVIGDMREAGYEPDAPDEYEQKVEQMIKKFIAGSGNATFYFFYSHRCPHCKKARPLVDAWEKKFSQIKFKRYEVTSNSENRELFEKVSKNLNISNPGVPTFTLGGSYVTGYEVGEHEELIEKMITEYLAGNPDAVKNASSDTTVDVPFLGKLDASLISLPSFTLIIGLLDGINPCAIWVLMFLLTLMVNTKSRKKLIITGTVFVVASGVVYFLFMTAWLNIFLFMGITETVTIILGVVAIIMGLINLKEFFFFKKGVSLMIPESAKPKLFKKMRSVMGTDNVILGLVGTIALAFFVNLIELGCTIGLPAIYTRVLSISDISTLQKYLYMALYNVYYVVPLALIVLLFVFTMGKYRFEERYAKILKVVSGILMLTLGIILVIKPELLIFI